MSGDILLLSRYGPLGASSRVRSYQYLPALAAAGFRVTVHPLLGDAYVAARNRERDVPIAEVVRGYARRMRDLWGARRHAAIWVEYEALPWLPFALEHRLYDSGRPVVVDYDDAIFHRYDDHRNAIVRGLLGDRIDRIMRAATVVVAGNDYLAERAHRAGARRVEILPSVIDLEHYRQKQDFSGAGFNVGWIGSATTTPYLRMLEPVLKEVADIPGFAVTNVGGAPWSPAGFAVENRPWSDTTEVADMLRFDVGVMPLPDEPWARGKCGFKIIQYMGCGLPVIASAVGVNAKIVEHDITGFIANSPREWALALRHLAAAPALRAAMGGAGHARVVRDYALSITAPRMVNLFIELTASG